MSESPLARVELLARR